MLPQRVASPSPALRCSPRQAPGGLWKDRLCARRVPRAAPLRGGRGAHHARRPAARPALRAALAPAGGGTRGPRAAPRAPRPPRPGQGRRFRSRLQRRSEPQHREHLLLLLHQPAWPGKKLASLARLPGPCQTSAPVAALGPFGKRPRETPGTGGPLAPFLTHRDRRPAEPRVLRDRPWKQLRFLSRLPGPGRWHLWAFPGTGSPAVCGSRPPTRPSSRKVTGSRVAEGKGRNSGPNLLQGRKLVPPGWFRQTLLSHSALGWKRCSESTTGMCEDGRKLQNLCAYSQSLPGLPCHCHTSVLLRSRQTRPDTLELQPCPYLLRCWF